MIFDKENISKYYLESQPIDIQQLTGKIKIYFTRYKRFKKIIRD